MPVQSPVSKTVPMATKPVKTPGMGMNVRRRPEPYTELSHGRFGSSPTGGFSGGGRLGLQRSGVTGLPMAASRRFSKNVKPRQQGGIY